MHAMVLSRFGSPLELVHRPTPQPGVGQVRVQVLVCAVCRTDLHVVDGELPQSVLPIVPGHEIVGIVDSLGPGVDALHVGQHVGIAWLGHTCGHCQFCHSGHENLCDAPRFTGCQVDGGFASHTVAEAAFCLPLDDLLQHQDAAHIAPLLCAGLIGWRCLKAAGVDSRRLGLYGFGAAAHLVAQVA